MPAQVDCSLKLTSGVLTLNGYGIRIAVERGHLVVEDGVGNERRQGRFARVPHLLKRLIVLGHSGIISFEALRWIQDTGAAFVQVDTDGRVIAATVSVGLDDSRLRRAQALSTANGVAVKIGRELTRDKLNAQLQNLQRLPASVRSVAQIKACIDELAVGTTPEDLRGSEARAALAYWTEWRDVPMKFEPRDAKRIPEHWLSFGQRHSLLSKPSPRRASNPPNAILNYLYAILEAEARIAALRMGLDPGIGLLHADQGSRNSLPCDLMEPVRPKVDAYVLDLLASRTFKKTDFFETREGICRLMPPLSHQLFETALLWARELAPVTEQVGTQSVCVPLHLGHGHGECFTQGRTQEKASPADAINREQPERWKGGVPAQSGAEDRGKDEGLAVQVSRELEQWFGSAQPVAAAQNS